MTGKHPEQPSTFSLRAVFRGVSSSTSIQFLRYVFVGSLAFLVDFTALAVLHYALDVHYLNAAAIGFGLGLVLSYLISVSWVFDTRQLKRPWLEFIVFCLIGLIGLALNQLVIWAITEHILAIPLAAKPVAAAIIMAWNFTAKKLLLF